MLAIAGVLPILLARPVVSALTNGTIDGADPRLYDVFPPAGLGGGRTLEFGFTGSAIYIFLAVNEDSVPLDTMYRLALDGVRVGRSPAESEQTPASKAGPRYNILAYANQTIPNAAHKFQVQLWDEAAVHFAYAIVTSNESDSISTDADSPRFMATRRRFTPSRGLPRRLAKREVSITAISGGIAAGVAFLLAVISLLMLWRGRNRPLRDPTRSPDRDPTLPLIPLAPMEHLSDAELGRAPDARALEEEVRMLREQVKRLEAERREASSATSESSSASVSVSRSFSTMKREQVQAVQAHHDGYASGDSLLHTDSGLRLTAARVVPEFPPTYMAQ